ncbi:hypothetical protein R1flu_019510 [Riccia fluitans]|uniref:Uncharacterized protein n=1 Tax=Riccia fluitans TaxID=41844 RepID=A0ABD1ZJW9_9MARC
MGFPICPTQMTFQTDGVTAPPDQSHVDSRIATWHRRWDSMALDNFSARSCQALECHTFLIHASFIVERSSLTSTRSRHRLGCIVVPSYKRMHASNLLKAVLKPRSITSSGQSLNTNDSKSRSSSRASKPETSLSVSVSKKAAPKMSCLCAPTNHAGSFRCRLHRGNQQSWGGKPLTPAAPAAPPTPKSTPSPAENPTPVSPEAALPVGDTGISKRLLHHQTSRQPSNNFSHPHNHRSFDGRPSRLSRVSVANEAEIPAVAEAVVSVAPSREAPGTVRYLKFTGGAGCASAAVLETGVVAIKKLQVSGKKDVMLDVFGSEKSRSGPKDGSVDRVLFDGAESTNNPRRPISSKYEQGPLLRNVKCAW